MGSPVKDVPQWWNGRRAGFKILFRKECPFESGLGHHPALVFPAADGARGGAFSINRTRAQRAFTTWRDPC